MNDKSSESKDLRRTRKDPRRARTRKRLIDATMEIIRKSGAGALSVAAVAREARIHPPGFYLYFKDIDECAQVASEELGKTLVARYNELRRKYASNPPSRKGSLRFTELAYKEWMDVPQIGEILVRCRYEDSPMGENVRKHIDRARAILADDLRIVARRLGIRDPYLQQVGLLAELCFATFYAGLASLLADPDQDIEVVARIVSHFNYDAVAAAFEYWRVASDKATAASP